MDGAPEEKNRQGPCYQEILTPLGAKSAGTHIRSNPLKCLLDWLQGLTEEGDWLVSDWELDKESVGNVRRSVSVFFASVFVFSVCFCFSSSSVPVWRFSLSVSLFQLLFLSLSLATSWSSDERAVDKEWVGKSRSRSVHHSTSEQIIPTEKKLFARYTKYNST